MNKRDDDDNDDDADDDIEPYVSAAHVQIKHSDYPYVIASSKNFKAVTATELTVKLTPDYHSKVYVYEMTIELCCRQPVTTRASISLLVSDSPFNYLNEIEIYQSTLLA